MCTLTMRVKASASCPGSSAQPFRGVVHDGAQAVGVLLELVDEGEDAGFAGKVRRQGQRAALAQLVERRTRSLR